MSSTNTPLPAPSREGDVPLYSIDWDRLPPKTTILVLWRSYMAVVNWAQVDAQFPFPTVNDQLGRLHGDILTDDYFSRRPNLGWKGRKKCVYQHLLEVKRRGGRDGHVRGGTHILVNE